MTMGPETREILQCVYAPRAPLPTESETALAGGAAGSNTAGSANPGSRPEAPTVVIVPDRHADQLGLPGADSVFAKQAILAAAVTRAPDIAATLKLVDESVPDRAVLVSAMWALQSAKPAAAAPLLAAVPLEHTVRFAEQVLAARATLLAGHDKAARSAAEADLAQDEAVLAALRQSAAVDPVGFLHLERLHFTPMRYRKGDLVYSVTLMPGETVRLTHREWSKTEREFTSLVAETLENEKEESVAEKSELTESNTSQRSHSMAFSASLSVSGSYGFVSFAANAGLQLSDQTNTTRQVSSSQTRENTRKASSRAKKEHKVTFRVATTTETEDTSFRELNNASNEAARWDFHRMMREWKVELYRYGIRLTYDVTIPEPGSYLLYLHRLADRLATDMAAPVLLPRTGDVRPDRYEALQQQYDVLLDPPPAEITLHATATVTYDGENDDRVANTIGMTIPEGYTIDPYRVVVDAPIEAWRGWDGGAPPGPTNRTSYTDMREEENRQRLSGAPVTQSFSWRYTVYWTDHPLPGARAVAGLRYVVRPLPSTIADWRSRAYARLAEALRARHDEHGAELSRQHDLLVQRLAGDDALALRRIEREEVMKGVLRWIFGPTFRFYPPDLPQRLGSPSDSEDLVDPGVDEVVRGLYRTDGSVINEQVWRHTLAYGQLISFLHQAIEWENVSYVLYPYFWSDPTRWADKQAFRHYDPTHGEFLRAGAARVVITIRPGFEAAWVHLVTTGSLASPGHAGDAAYLRIAQEIKNAAATYQPHAAGENPLDLPGLLIDQWTEWTPTGALDVERGGSLDP